MASVPIAVYNWIKFGAKKSISKVLVISIIALAVVSPILIRNYNLFGNPELTELAKLLSIEKLDQAKIIPYEEAISKEEGVKNALKAVLDNYLTGSSFNKEIFFGKIGIDQILLQDFESALKLKDTKKISDKLVESMFAYRSRKLIRRY